MLFLGLHVWHDHSKLGSRQYDKRIILIANVISNLLIRGN